MSRTPFSCLQEKVQENRGFSGLAFLPCGHGSVLAGVRSIRFDQCPRPEFLLHLLQSFARVQLLRVCRHRRASVVDGRPSTCHGCAVACIGQPPPPSAPWPGARGWVVGPVCGPRLRWRGFCWLPVGWVRLDLASRGCAGGYTFWSLFVGGCDCFWPGAGRVVSMSKTATAQGILVPLVCLYC